VKARHRLALLALGLVLAVGVAAVLVWRSRTSPAALRRAFERAAARYFDGTLVVEHASLSPRGVLTVRGLQLRPTGQQEPLLTCEEAVLQFGLLRLLGGGRVPRRLVLKRPRLALRYDAAERQWNVQGALRPDRWEAPPGGGTADVLSGGVAVEDGVLAIRSAGLFADDREHEITGLRLSAAPTSADPQTWTVSGVVQEGVLRGAELSGWLSVGREAGCYLRVSADDLLIGPEVLALVPFGARLQKVLQPAGRVAGTAVVSYAAGRVQCGGTLTLKGVRMLTRYFPAPLEEAVGRVEISESGVAFHDVSGTILPRSLGLSGERTRPVRVSCTGTYQFHPERLTLALEAMDMPICRQSVEAIPRSGAELWRQLRPGGGTARVSLRVEVPGEGWAATAALSDVGLRPVWLPVGLRRVAGRLEVGPQAVQLLGVTGLLAQEGRPGHASVTGTLDPRTLRAELRVELRGVRADENMVRWLPGFGRELWDGIRPQGVVDGTVLLRGSLREGWPEVHGALRISEGRAAPVWLPVAVEGLAGTVGFDLSAGRPARVRFSGLTGLIRQRGSPAHVRLDGTLNADSYEGELKLELKGLRADEHIVRWLPGFGERLWKSVRPEGVVDASLRLRGPLAGDRAAVYGTLLVSSGSALLTWLPVPMREVSATLHFDPARVQIARASGRLCPAGEEPERGAGSVAASGVIDLAGGESWLEVRSSDLQVGRELVERLPGSGKSLWSQLEPEGRVAVTGRVRLKGQSAQDVSYSMDVHLKNASAVWKPVPVRLQALSGHVILTDRMITVPAVSGRAATGLVQLSGEADLENGGEQVRYRGILEFRRADLRPLLAELGVPDSNVGGRLSGLVELGGRLGTQESMVALGSVQLSEGRLLSAPFFMGLVDALHLSVPGTGGDFDTGEAHFELQDNELHVTRFRLASGTVELEGHGEIALPGWQLDLAMVAATLPEGGLPIISKGLRLVMRPVEKGLVRLQVTGTIAEPKFEPQVLGPLKRPIGSLWDLLTGPFRGGSREE